MSSPSSSGDNFDFGAATGTEGRPAFLRQDGTRNHIQPDDVRGKWTRARMITYAALIGIYVAVPFIRIGEHPAVHLDIPARRFWLWGAAYNSQDAWLVVFLLLAFTFGLIFVTAWAGRGWCGWACPQTVFLEGVYRKVERWIEGPSVQRQRLQAGPWSVERVVKLVAKHGAFLAVSLGLAHVFLAFFVPVKDLTRIVLEGPAGHGTLFAWAMAITFLLQFNFAWFREQLCFIVCPYGRFQSALIDQHSVIIGYDRTRGEPRGRRLKVLPSAPPPKALGDCVDCGRCVRVCPTGIDIRNGLQMECVGCAQCIDACDEIMDKVGKPRGLVRYDSLEGLAGRARKLGRPRLYVYGLITSLALLFVGAQVFGLRDPFEANLLRSRGMPYALEPSTIRNQFELHVINKHPEPVTFALKLKVPPGVTVVVPQETFTLGPLESLRTPFFLTIDRAAWKGPFPFEVEVSAGAKGRKREVKGQFLGPPVPRPG